MERTYRVEEAVECIPPLPEGAIDCISLVIEFNLIRRIAWAFHNTTGVDINELIGEGSLAYCEAALVYDPDRGAKWTTFAYKVIVNRLRDFCKSERYHSMYNGAGIRPEDLEDSGSYRLQYYYLPSFEELHAEFSTWPKNCQEVIKIILEDSKPFINLPPKLARGKLAEVLREKGWKYENIWTVIQDMKSILKSWNSSYC